MNLLPEKGKVCNFDCIYCECGWNKDGRDDKIIPPASKVRAELERKLSDCLLTGEKIDSITFSGDGEPTLNPEFPRIIDDTLALRDAFFPDSKVSVLSNGTTAHMKVILDALKKVDNPIMKLDAPTNDLVKLINRPYPGYDVNSVIESLMGFNGGFILQTMFLKCPYFDSSSREVLLPWMDIVRKLQPKEIMVYTINRPTPETGLEKFSEEQMKKLVQPLIDDGFRIQIKG